MGISHTGSSGAIGAPAELPVNLQLCVTGSAATRSACHVHGSSWPLLSNPDILLSYPVHVRGSQTFLNVIYETGSVTFGQGCQHCLGTSAAKRVATSTSVLARSSFSESIASHHQHAAPANTHSESAAPDTYTSSLCCNPAVPPSLRVLAVVHLPRPRCNTCQRMQRSSKLLKRATSSATAAARQHLHACEALMLARQHV